MAEAGLYIIRGGVTPTLIDPRVVLGHGASLTLKCGTAGTRQYTAVYGWYKKRDISEKTMKMCFECNVQNRY